MQTEIKWKLISCLLIPSATKTSKHTSLYHNYLLTRQPKEVVVFTRLLEKMFYNMKTKKHWTKNRCIKYIRNGVKNSNAGIDGVKCMFLKKCNQKEQIFVYLSLKPHSWWPLFHSNKLIWSHTHKDTHKNIEVIIYLFIFFILSNMSIFYNKYFISKTLTIVTEICYKTSVLFFSFLSLTRHLSNYTTFHLILLKRHLLCVSR